MIAKLRWKTVNRISQPIIFCPSLSGFLHTPDSVHDIWAEKRWLGRVPLKGISLREGVFRGQPSLFILSLLPLLKRSSRISQLRPESGLGAYFSPKTVLSTCTREAGSLGKSLFDLVWKAVGQGSVPLMATMWLPAPRAANQPSVGPHQTVPHLPLGLQMWPFCFRLHARKRVGTNGPPISRDSTGASAASAPCLRLSVGVLTTHFLLVCLLVFTCFSLF